MRLETLIAGFSFLKILHYDPSLEVRELAIDSRIRSSDVLFAAVKGTHQDGHAFIDMALDSGASVILCQEIPQRVRAEVVYLCVDDTSVMISLLADRFYDSPSKKLKVVGITGTNAKTSIATILHSTCQRLGVAAGLISTVCVCIGDQRFEATHTTPGPIEVQKWLYRMVLGGCHYVFIEVSSHALIQNRVRGVFFSGALFSNLTQDHLDYHGTMEAYRDAKKKLFDQLTSEAFALTNVDDANGLYFLQSTKAQRYNYGVKRSSDFPLHICTSTLEGLCLRVGQIEFWVSWVGRFNAWNFAAAFGALRLLGFGEATVDICKIFSSVLPPRGRMEKKKATHGLHIYIDYAHTPDALKKLLMSLREIRLLGRQILTVVGCGGDRDQSKRKLMARVASTLSDKVIFTSDNPRFESPSQIIDQMMTGVLPLYQDCVEREEDRSKAILHALETARSGDIVLIAGKGHEVYQETRGKKTPFDDREVIDLHFKTIKNINKIK